MKRKGALSMYTKCVKQKCQDYKKREQLSSKSSNEEKKNSPEALTHSNRVRRNKRHK
jgi:hypothetical protein